MVPLQTTTAKPHYRRWMYPPPHRPAMVSSTDDASLRAKKRQYNRDKQREFRKKLEMELEDLRGSVKALEYEVNTRRGRMRGATDGADSSFLPWRDVAAVFSQSAMTAVHTNRALKSEIKHVKLLAECMHAWVHSATPRFTTPRDRFATGGGPMVLHKSHESRKIAAEWITDRLGHNADAIFHAHGMPSEATRLADIVVSRDASGIFEYVTRHQRAVDAPFDHVCQAYTLISQGVASESGGIDLVLSNRVELDKELMRSVGKDIVYSQATLVRAGHEWRDNKLWRTFRTPTRLLIVSQNVLEDDAHPVTRLQRHRFSIVAVDRLTDGKTLTRQLNYNSQAFSAADGAYVSLDIEMQQFSADLSHVADDEVKAEKWAAIQLQRGTSVCQGMERHFNNALERAMESLSLQKKVECAVAGDDAVVCETGSTNEECQS
ncbi:Aste57867_24779 [Aphanomyces stellatus]|uniref:Aste57867_24779 protein n=1 Tax=Aphanomyces stellatus TaxID=120398 RepID=A0A485LSB5_9STRA|nr:hypothetical protein As57867_024701 [Aphanomyces stellatus]VFU01414.1 Aste57867_24779 [Aphanomyces stellatus]